MWSAEALLPVAGCARALRFEPELGDWSCWKLWMDKTTSSVIARGDQKFSLGRDNAAQIRKVPAQFGGAPPLINDAFELPHFEG